MIRELLSESKEQIDYFFAHLDSQNALGIFDALISCQGKIVFVGVGKSGIIAEKIAKTMASTGTKAISLSAADALHGDIAMVEEGDVVVAISKSGHTEELKNLLRMIKKRKTKIIGWFCNKEATLSSLCDLVMVLPIEKELCPFDLAPTTSTAVQLIFGDLMAVGLMRKKSFSIHDYALNHPAGSIGKSSTLSVEDLMLKGDRVPVCSRDDSLSDVLGELTSKRCGCILIRNENGEVEGIFTDGDLRRAIQTHQDKVFKQKIGDLMTKQFLHIEEQAMASEALSLMQNSKRVAQLPVLNKGRLSGIVLMHDLVNAGVI